MNTKNNLFALLLLLGFINSGIAQSLSINEFMADNDVLTGIVDEVGQSDDWIEIHNTTNATVDISGYFLSDKLDELNKWEVPAGYSIGPYGYKIIWADDDATQGPLHTNFKLSKSGESIYLSDPNGAIVDSVNYGEQTTNISFARIPNGTGDFIFKAPTFRYNNEATSSLNTPLKEAAFDVFPNPATEFFTINWTSASTEKSLKVNLYDAIGELKYSEVINRVGTETTTKVFLQQYVSGLYYLSLEAEEYRWVELLYIAE